MYDLLFTFSNNHDPILLAFRDITDENFSASSTFTHFW